MVPPHGGELIDRFIAPGALDEMEAQHAVALGDRLIFDALMIAMGGFSPLNGFMGREDYTSVLEEMRLASGGLFAIPIVLPVDGALQSRLQPGDTLALQDGNGRRIGVLDVSETFQRTPEAEAQAVYRTSDPAHPGVRKVHEEGNALVAGPLRLARERIAIDFPDDFLTPAETRAYLAEHGYRTAVAFQTRNPIHRAHEYLTKVALEMVDLLMIHPIVGEVKADDIPAETRMRCYKTLIGAYYNADRVLLNILPMAMRYAGPREAVHHAIVRQNYGMTHLIIGRDHAGVGDYYGTYDAQAIFDELRPDDLAIRPLKFEHAFFCRTCGQMVTAKTCPHDKSRHVFLSGTKVREKLRAGEPLPEEFTRREVSDLLAEWIAGQADHH